MCLGVGTFITVVWTAVQTNNIAITEVPYKESLDCWTGNACLAPLKTRLNPDLPGMPAPAPGATCDTPDRVCVTPPPVYPDGTCCNQNDFCYQADPNKICIRGQCVSGDPTLCRGFCEIDSDCTGSATPFPIYPTAEADAFCLNGACVALVSANPPVVSPNDLLNLSTMLAFNTSACLESSCFVFASGTGGTTTSTQICQYSWACSQLNGFYNQTVVSRKRSVTARAQLIEHLEMDDGTVVNVTMYHNFSLPGGSARYSRDQYWANNIALNQRLGAFLDSLNPRPPLTIAPTTVSVAPSK
jgi:hypothetical protein